MADINSNHIITYVPGSGRYLIPIGYPRAYWLSNASPNSRFGPWKAILKSMRQHLRKLAMSIPNGRLSYLG